MFRPRVTEVVAPGAEISKTNFFGTKIELNEGNSY